MSERPKSAATRPKQISTVGHYELDKNIGEGNFAKVKLAKHTITGQQVDYCFILGCSENY
jgi:serine/threonine protein kinase